MENSNLINGQKPEFGNVEQIRLLQKAERQIEDEKEYESLRKNMSPDEKQLDDEANIAWVFYCIDEMTKKVTARLGNRSPMDIIVDKATGYDKGVIKGFLTFLKDAYKELIKLLPKIGEDEQTEKYKALLEKIDIELKGDYKKVKATEL